MRVLPFFFLVIFTVSVHAQQWTELKPSGDVPVPRGNPTAIYDPVGHRLIAFGGRVPGGQLNDVWALDLNEMAWQNITPNDGPTPRWSHNAVYDPAGHRMLIWSGRRDGTSYNDVWAFDLNAETWAELTPSTSTPNLRYGTAAVFDPLAGELVSFAGFTEAGRFEDTWSFDPEVAQWTDRSNAVTPGKRCLHSASYDSRSHRMLIYGGQRGGGRLDDLWALDLSGDTWSELTPSEGPTGRSFAASAYDAIGDRFVIYGGDTGGAKSDEVWAFDLAEKTWNPLAVAGVGPSARSGAASIYIETENRILYFGGEAIVGFFNEVWALENIAQQETAVQPAGWARVKAAYLGVGDGQQE